MGGFGSFILILSSLFVFRIGRLFVWVIWFARTDRPKFSMFKLPQTDLAVHRSADRLTRFDRGTAASTALCRHHLFGSTFGLIHNPNTERTYTMANLNSVMLIGNVTHDPEIRYTPKGTPIFLEFQILLALKRIFYTEFIPSPLEGERLCLSLPPKIPDTTIADSLPLCFLP